MILPPERYLNPNKNNKNKNSNKPPMTKNKMKNMKRN